MKREQAIHVLAEWDEKGRCIYTLSDLASLFPKDNPKTLQEGLNRLVKAGILERAARGVYVYRFAHSKNSHLIETIAKTLRRGEYNYVSLESALSEYGLISQVPIDRLTVMTTGRRGEYHTPYGTIEFTHTKRKVDDVLDSMKDVGRPLRFATRAAALRDLKRVGRNLDLVNEEELAHERSG